MIDFRPDQAVRRRDQSVRRPPHHSFHLECLHPKHWRSANELGILLAQLHLTLFVQLVCVFPMPINHGDPPRPLPPLPMPHRSSDISLSKTQSHPRRPLRKLVLHLRRRQPHLMQTVSAEIVSVIHAQFPAFPQILTLPTGRPSARPHHVLRRLRLPLCLDQQPLLLPHFLLSTSPPPFSFRTPLWTHQARRLHLYRMFLQKPELPSPRWVALTLWNAEPRSGSLRSPSTRCFQVHQVTRKRQQSEVHKDRQGELAPRPCLLYPSQWRPAISRAFPRRTGEIELGHRWTRHTSMQMVVTQPTLRIARVVLLRPGEIPRRDRYG